MQNPKISVIIPNYNGRHYIDRLIVSLKRQTLAPEEFEIIVVDNGSTDGSWEVVQGYKKTMRNLNIVSYLNKKSSYLARNCGVSISRGSLLAFTDVDCIPNQEWVHILLNLQNEVWLKFIVSGRVELFPKGNEFNFYEWYDVSTALDQESYSKNGYGATANLSMARKTFDDIGGFEGLTSGGDRQFCMKASHRGYAIRYLPELVVRHPARDTYSGIIRKARRIGGGHSEIFMRTRPNLLRLAWFIGGTIVSLCLEINQWRVIRRTFLKRIFTGVDLLKFGCLFLWFGVVERYSILVSTFFLLSHSKEKVAL